MDSQAISPSVTEFLRENIASYEQLEALLWLHAHFNKAWTPDEIGATLHMPATIVSEAIDALCRRALVEVLHDTDTRRFRYRPCDAKRAAAVDGLARAYDGNRLGVMNLMSTNAIERVRTEAMHMFADAFLFARRKDSDG